MPEYMLLLYAGEADEASHDDKRFEFDAERVVAKRLRALLGAQHVEPVA